MTERTDWDRYYQSTPSYTSVTRKFSERKIVSLINQLAGGASLTICELGGANSCFVEAIFRHLDVSHYHVVDFNSFGLGLLRNKRVSGDLTWEHGDVLETYNQPEQFHVVYSVGLIEHFSTAETRKAVDHHFDRCVSGGLVMVTFPTPTILYRAIRTAAEITNRWSFPDERPLSFGEVEAACAIHGEVVHTSINWAIGLTQGYVLTRKR